MKELSIEEKAKRYDEAVINGSRLWECGEITRESYEYIFRELAESEDERIRKALIDGFTVMKESKNCGKTFSNHNIPVADILAWLEKQGEQKQEWSEEDKKMLDFAISAVGLCRQYAINHQVNGYSNLPDVPKRYEELQNWLKSLRHQKQWKPSEEQMEVLHREVEAWSKTGITHKVLSSLYNDLKAL